MLISAMRPGARISELQAKGRDIYRREGVPDPAAAVIFFHGLGLSHMDIEQTLADGSPNGDWTLEDGMIVPVPPFSPGREPHPPRLDQAAAIAARGRRAL